MARRFVDIGRQKDRSIAFVIEKPPVAGTLLSRVASHALKVWRDAEPVPAGVQSGPGWPPATLERARELGTTYESLRTESLRSLLDRWGLDAAGFALLNPEEFHSRNVFELWTDEIDDAFCARYNLPRSSLPGAPTPTLSL